MWALRRVSGVCAPSALHPCAGKQTFARSTTWKWRARAETAGTTVNVAGLAIAVLQLEATPAAARRRYMALAG